MKKEKTKVYTYTRVSTAMQVDGYSLDAQKAKMKAYADYNDYEIVGEYEDAGKSGKSIEGRAQFSQMMEDIKSGKDGKTFGSVSTKEIAAAVKEQLGLELDKKKMVVNDGIKALGTYEVPIKLHPKVMGTLRVKVTEQ